MNKNIRPRLAVTLGDPAGIGPEVVLKALADPEVIQGCEVTVVGSRSLLLETHTQLSRHPQLRETLADPQQLDILDVPVNNQFYGVHTSGDQPQNAGVRPPNPPILGGTGIQSPPELGSQCGLGVSPSGATGVDLGGKSTSNVIRNDLCVHPRNNQLGEIKTGIGNAASGAASFAYMKVAIERTLAGEFQGIVTGPISKTDWKAAGYDYPGQTELLAEAAGVKRFGMLFVARSPHTGWTLRTLLATTHIPLCQVSTALTPELLTLKLDLLVECLQQDFGLEKARITIAGLNPHSGENGQLGSEEKDWLIPWLEAERKRRPNLILEGPVPPDTLWVKPGQAWFGNAKFNFQNAADAYLALYHDQGLIPVKLMAFDRAVNTTIGLPFIRTSPDHGTAFDIAGKGIADASSMKAALLFAAEVVQQRKKPCAGGVVNENFNRLSGPADKAYYFTDK